MENTIKHSDQIKKKDISKMLPLILAFTVLMFYVSFFIMVINNLLLTHYQNYLAPVLLQNRTNNSFFASPIENSFLYPKIILFCIIIPLLFTSYILSSITEGKEIPNEYPWIIQSLHEIESNPQQQIEALAIEIVNRTDTLLKTSNRLYLSKSRNQTSQSFLNSSISSINTLSSMARDSVSSDDYYIINERTDKNEIRYCGTCRKFRPDRCHHCKQCNKCYLKMDHHCSWLNNCISMTNYKYFLSTLFYSSSTCLLFSWCLFDIIKMEFSNESSSSIKLSALVVYFILTVTFFVLLFMLLTYHLNLIMSNFTTFEHSKLAKEYELKKPERKVLYNKIDAYSNIKMNEMSVSMYDFGKWNNFIQVFGVNPLLWLLPIRSDSYSKGYGNGFNFETNNKKNVIEEIRSI